jgi:uncharacterized membrane protein
MPALYRPDPESRGDAGLLCYGPRHSPSPCMEAGMIGDHLQEFFAFLSRWGHILSGVTWIGILYYFNFVQVPSFAQFEAGPRTEAIRKLVPRALWWFRYGALLTLLFGLSILGFNEQFDGDYFMKTAPGVSIGTGIILALFMFTNVWMFIWPKQKIVIASAERVAGGGEADPEAVPAGRRALLCSRTNTLLSIPMLFFMAFTSHFAGIYGAASSGDAVAFYIFALVVASLIEANALGVFGGNDGPLTKPLGQHKNVIIAGFVMAALFTLVFELCFG